MSNQVIHHTKQIRCSEIDMCHTKNFSTNMKSLIFMTFIINNYVLLCTCIPYTNIIKVCFLKCFWFYKLYSHSYNTIKKRNICRLKLTKIRRLISDGSNIFNSKLFIKKKKQCKHISKFKRKCVNICRIKSDAFSR